MRQSEVSDRDRVGAFRVLLPKIVRNVKESCDNDGKYIHKSQFRMEFYDRI